MVSRQPMKSAHFLCGAHHPPQSTPVSFAFMAVSLHVGTAREKLKFIALPVAIFTLTNIGFTNTTHTVWTTIASQSIDTFFRGQAAATAVYVSLIAIHNAIVARRNCNRDGGILPKRSN